MIDEYMQDYNYDRYQ
ncbi:hypothetical protein [Bacillus cytotoxicus]